MSRRIIVLTGGTFFDTFFAGAFASGFDFVAVEDLAEEVFFFLSPSLAITIVIIPRHRKASRNNFCFIIILICSTNADAQVWIKGNDFLHRTVGEEMHRMIGMRKIRTERS